MSDPVIRKIRWMSLVAVPALLATVAMAAAPGAAPVAKSSPADVASAALAPPAPPAPPDPPEPPDAPRRARRGWLGIVLGDGDTEVTHVVEDSPADRAGLKRGDRILEIDGHEVEDAGDVVAEVRRHEPGDEVRLRVERDGQERTLSATLERSRGRRAPRAFGFHVPGHDWEGEGDVMVFRGRPMLGVQVHPMSEELRAYFKAPREQGVLIDRVIEDTPAEKAGLRAGDVIIAVGDEEVERIGDIGRALRDHEEGDRVSVKVIRDGSERTIDIMVEETERPAIRPRSIVIPSVKEIKLKSLDALNGLGESLDDLDVDVKVEITQEVREQIERAMKDAHRAMEESLRGIHEVLGDEVEEEVLDHEAALEAREEALKAMEDSRREMERELRRREVQAGVRYDI